MARRRDTFLRLRSQAGLAREYLCFLRTLYWHSNERTELVDRVGRDFAVLLFRSLLDSLVLILSRLLDDAHANKNQKNRRNLSILGLTQSIRDDEPQHFPALALQIQEVEDAIKEAEQLMPAIRDWRNKFIAHLDESAVLDNMPSVQYAWGQLEDITERVCDIVERLSDVVFVGGMKCPTPTALQEQLERFVVVLKHGLAIADASIPRSVVDEGRVSQ